MAGPADPNLKLDPTLEKCEFRIETLSTPTNEDIEAYKTPPKLETSEHDFEWLAYMDLVHKRELVVAVEDELRERGWMNETAENDTPNRRSPADIRATMKDLAEASRKDESLHQGTVSKEVKLMHELDFRLRNYYLALLRNRDVDILKSYSGWPGRETKTQGSTSSRNSKESKSEAKSSEHTSYINIPQINSNHIEKPPMDPKKPTWQSRVVYSLLTIAFIIGGLVGLYFETERPKRVGLVIFFVCLFIVLLVVKRVRPEDMFLLAAAYTAVLVVFLSGDLAGPQEVIVDLVRSGDNTLAVSSTIPVASATLSNQQPQSSSATSVAPAVPAMPTDQTAPSSFVTSLPSGMPSTFSTVTLTTPTPSLTTPISQDPAVSSAGTSTPTATPEPDAPSRSWTVGKIAGVAVGTIAGVVIVVALVIYRLRQYSLDLESGSG